jgi:hypothetical protein
MKPRQARVLEWKTDGQGDSVFFQGNGVQCVVWYFIVSGQNVHGCRRLRLPTECMSKRNWGQKKADRYVHSPWFITSSSFGPWHPRRRASS